MIFRTFKQNGFFMKKYIFTLVFFFSTICTAQQLSLQTSIGNITLPEISEINKQLNDLTSNNSISDENKELKRNLYNQGIDALNKIYELRDAKNKLEASLKNPAKKLATLIKNYSTEQNATPISDDMVSKMSNEELKTELERTNSALATAQIEIASAVQARDYVQTLPEKAKNTVTANTSSAKENLLKIDEKPNTEDFDNRILATLIYRANLENEFLKESLNNISTLQDLTTYKLKITTLKLQRLEQDVKKLSLAVNKTYVNEDEYANQNLTAKKHPALKKYIESIDRIKGYISVSRTKDATYLHDLQMVNSAYSKVDQTAKSLDKQINELGQTLVLSRLLNRQLTNLPEINLKYNLDDELANLNIYIFELRDQLEKLTDIDTAVQEEIKKDPSLSSYKTDLVALVSEKRQAINELYQVIANELTTIIELKVVYTQYNDINNQINSKISEQLFWVKSNQGLGVEFFSMFIPAVKYESANLITKFNSEKFIKHTVHTSVIIILPLMFFGLILLALRPVISRINNELALRLDRSTDSIFVTPLALITNIMFMVPRLCWLILLGTVVICCALATTEKQSFIILTMVLHIFVFVFFSQILKPNALVQRHFCVEPYKLKKFRQQCTKIWIFAIPLLIFANVAETDSNYIYSDITSYLVVLVSFIALFVIFSRELFAKLKDLKNATLSSIALSLVAIVICLIAIISVASGYLYTIVKLTNRVAYTCYIALGYYIVSQTVHRMIYVYINKSFFHTNDIGDHKNKSIVSQLNMAPGYICSKIFKIVNTALLILTVFLMYFQWNDLASVLRYLETITLYSDKQVVNGQVVLTNVLTLANVLFAIIVIVITGVLNKNLPLILEKIFMLKKDENQKSTSYTVKVISSYLILGIGCIFAAGAIGIKWENLQWLVAALSVGLGFGLQEIFANFVSGIILLFERQIRVGDIITLNGLSGTVSKIRIRSTTVLSFENKEVMIPNKEFITSALTNWSLSNQITKMSFVVGIAYGADVDKAKSLLKGIINRCQYISKEQASLVYVSSLDDSAVTITSDIYVTQIANRKLTTDYLSRETLKQFAQYGIEIPFNQLDVNVKNLEKGEFIETLKTGMLAEKSL